MLQPLSPSRSSQKNSKAQRRPLSRESSLKQVKLSDLFGSSSSSSSPVAPLTTSKAYNVHSERHRQYSPPPRMSQVETSTPCGPSSSSLAHRDMLLDIDSTDSEPESDSHSGAGSARKKARLELDVPFGFQTRPTSATHQARPYIRHVAGPKPKINHQSFYPGLNRPLNPLRWRAALETSLPLSSGLHSATLDRSAYMTSFKSHPTADQYFIDSFNDHSFSAPPFACAFTHEAKQGGKPILAVASEDGVIQTVNTELPQQEGLSSRGTIFAHQNAIFDLKWSPDDSLLATSSGDQTIGVFDPKTNQRVISLSGHLCTTKCVEWNTLSPNVLASASRDGSIRIWDTRTGIQPINGEAPDPNLNLVKNAHGLYSKQSSKKRTSVRSPTSIVWSNRQPNQLFSAGSADGVVKLWDLRRSLRRFANPPAAAVSPDHELEHSKRSRGITSIALSPDSATLYALSASSQIIALDAHDITRKHPVNIFCATPKEERLPYQGGQNAHFRAGSFYVRLALSSNDNGRFLVVGSTDGSVWMWDTQTSQASNDICLSGHSKEVGGLDTARDMVASCSDDLSVRVWRSNTSWQAQSWLGVEQPMI